MSIQSEIDRINGNVASTYTALSEMGATIPETQNSDNLPGTVRTVPQGGGSGGKTVQADWNQNDSSAADFIKNKTHGDILVEVMPEMEVTGVDSDGLYMTEGEVSGISGGEELSIKFDGVEYRCSAFYFEDGIYYYGNPEMLGLPDNGIPFVLGIMPGSYMLMLFDTDMHRIGISLCIVNKLHHKYVGSNTLFYSFEGDEYLYTDEWRTNKATKADVRRAAESGTIVIQMFAIGLGGFALVASEYPYYINLVTAEYAIVVAQEITNLDPLNIKQFIRYTAEYEPTT